MAPPKTKWWRTAASRPSAAFALYDVRFSLHFCRGSRHGIHEEKCLQYVSDQTTLDVRNARMIAHPLHYEWRLFAEAHMDLGCQGQATYSLPPECTPLGMTTSNRANSYTTLLHAGL
jgi:hypothetical protein